MRAVCVQPVCKLREKNMTIRRIPMSLNLVVRQNLWASVPYIDVQRGVKPQFSGFPG